MFLLNNILIRDYVKTDSPILDIWNYEEHLLQHTFYYFRLGSDGLINGNPFKLSNTPENKKLILQPGDFALIKTHETFIISEKLLAIFGQSSDLTRKGLQLVHSPFVDPKFKGNSNLESKISVKTKLKFSTPNK